MDRRDTAGIVAASALLLAAGAWVFDGLGFSPHGVADARGLEQASRQALESQPVGGAVTWRDTHTGVVATITPAMVYRDGDGRWCRPYSLTLAVNDTRHPATRHIACRDANGRWLKRAEAEPANARLDRWLARLGPGPGEQIAGW